MIHALAVKATLPPLGRREGALAPVTSRWLPRASVKAPLAAPKWSATKMGAVPVSPSAAVPSASLPERKKAVSEGEAPVGRQPDVVETRTASTAQWATQPAAAP